MIAVAGVLTGYNGSFEFKEPGQKYEDTPYIGMRVVRGVRTRIWMQMVLRLISLYLP